MIDAADQACGEGWRQSFEPPEPTGLPPQHEISPASKGGGQGPLGDAFRCPASGFHSPLGLASLYFARKVPTVEQA